MPEPQLRITLADGSSHQVSLEGADPELHLEALLHGREPYHTDWISVQARGRHYVRRSAVVHVILTGLGEEHAQAMP